MTWGRVKRGLIFLSGWTIHLKRVFQQGCGTERVSFPDPRARAARTRLRCVRVCSARSRSRWSSRYIDTRAWRSARANARDHRVRRRGTGVRVHAHPHALPRSSRARSSRHTGHSPKRTGTGSTARSWGPPASRTRAGTERKRALCRARAAANLHTIATSGQYQNKSINRLYK